MLNGNLSWRTQVVNTAKKINAALYQLKLCRDLLSEPLRLKLVSTLIFILNIVIYTDMSSE